jgi:DNA-directed RNA polymerase subunit RPC12/RpoP
MAKFEYDLKCWNCFSHVTSNNLEFNSACPVCDHQLVVVGKIDTETHKIYVLDGFIRMITDKVPDVSRQEELIIEGIKFKQDNGTPYYQVTTSLL